MDPLPPPSSSVLLPPSSSLSSPPLQQSVRSSASSSSLRLIRDSATTMFERVMGRKRQEDYHRRTTTPTSPPPSTTMMMHASIREEGGGEDTMPLDHPNVNVNHHPNHHIPTPPPRPRNLHYNDDDDDNHHHPDDPHSQHSHQIQRRRQRQLKYHTMIRSPLWNIGMIFFAVLLLFGDSLRTIFLPPVLDNTMDVLFIITILFFLYDIYIRIAIIEEEHYVTVPAFCGGRRTVAGGRPPPRHSWYDVTTQVLTCASFLFWCDLLSTLALLYDITWFNVRNFREGAITITLDTYGIPTTGLDKINEAKPYELDPQLLVTILQSARVARFIRSSSAVKLSSKVNWFYLLNLCNPLWWFQQCFRPSKSILCCRRPAADTGTPLSPSRSNNGSSAVMSLSSGVSTLVSSSQPLSPPLTTSASASPTESGRRSSDPSNDHSVWRHKKSTWETLGHGFVATNRMKNGSTGYNTNATNNHNNNNGRNGLSRTISQWFMGPSNSAQAEAIRYHLAALKIQRAWRSLKRSSAMNLHPDDTMSAEFSDVAWKGRMSHSTINPSLTNSTRAFPSTASKSSRMVQSAVTNTTDQLNSIANTTVVAANATMNSLSDVHYNYKRRNESQVGSAMRELTGQRVAIGIIVALLLTVIFTYTEQDATRPTTMIVLHSQTRFDAFVNKSLNAARMTAVPDLFSYQLANGEVVEYNVVENGRTPSDLRPVERLRITISTTDANVTTIGSFMNYSERREQAIVTILSTLFIVSLWFFGVTAFAGPVMVLVVIPIERMVRLLGMLMVDPLGYQSTSRYKRFVDEENEITKNTRWTKEILKGMETSFLMSTILRIGSLMKVGFGSAGVEIIRNNLEKGQSKNMLILSSQGSTVSCIFLFCDIRSFTDATECLQEEVFVFTNRIAAVVHSNVHSYGGSANKNVGDAFLLSWLLDEDTAAAKNDNYSSHKRKSGTFSAKSNQADKCLLSVVRICMALYHDDYYIGAMTEAAREALVMKLQHRKGPIVQMGFGMHAGRAVQGAIGSQRKIDATYVSEAVERAEFLESSTKRYGVPMLMSDSFHRLLHPSNRRRCRKIDQILIQEDYDDDNEEDDKDTAGDIMELFTFDIDVASLWAKKTSMAAAETSARDGTNSNDNMANESSRRGTLSKQPRENRRSSNNFNSSLLSNDSDELNTSTLFLGTNSANNSNNNPSSNHPNDADSSGGGGGGGGNTSHNSGDDPTTLLHRKPYVAPPTLVLPTGPALYNANVWTSDDMRTMRQLYSDGLFFQNFMSGLQSYYTKDWEHATQCFTTILQRFEDGPSRYFLSRIEEHNGIPPKDFVGYGIP